MPSHPVVAVTGASGLLGRHLVTHLTKAISQSALIALGRRDPGYANVQWRHCDFAIPEPPDLTGVNVVVHLAAEKRDPAIMEQVNVRGTRQLLHAMLEAGTHRLVHLSSVGVYGAGSKSGVVTESFLRRPKNEYERTKAAAEELLQKAAREIGLEVLVLQPSNVLAPDPGRHYPLLGFARAVSRGRFAFVERSAAILNYVSVRNVSAAIESGVTRRDAGVFILNTPIDLERALRIITDELQLPYPQRSLARGLALTAGLVADAVAKLTRRPMPFSLSRVRELTNTTVFDGSRASVLFDGEYPVSIESALAQLMREYRAAALV
jgi:nucleoside-diphosphate-sugar epimerase